MKFSLIEKMGKNVAKKAFDEYEYKGKTIRQWADILKDYDDKQATLQRIAKRFDKKIVSLENDRKEAVEHDDGRAIFALNNQIRAFNYSLNVIMAEGGGMHDLVVDYFSKQKLNNLTCVEEEGDLNE